eukprot:GHVT01031950.1.p2 GENE.GHVT01031950.1~~GHVT01031950.1.p2  ORF type:complete len:913 (-),score=208.09 GHVT01031950.1:5264-8002(-)
MLRLRQFEGRRRQAQQATDSLPIDSVNAAKQLLASKDASKVPWDEQICDAVHLVFHYFIHSFKKSAAPNADGRPVEAASASSSTAAQHQLELEREAAQTPYYINKMYQTFIASDNKNLQIDTDDLARFPDGGMELTRWIQHKPTEVLAVLDLWLLSHIHSTASFQNALANTDVSNRLFRVVFCRWPYLSGIRSLRACDMNKFVKLKGIVTRRSGMIPKLKELFVACAMCGYRLSETPVAIVEGQKLQIPRRCPECQGNNFVADRVLTKYADMQRLTVQETPGSVPAGRAPRSRQVIVMGELVDQVKPGEEVEVTGIYKTKFDEELNVRTSFPVFATEIIANNITRSEEDILTVLTAEDLNKIRALSRERNIRDRIIASIAPSLWGAKPVKRAIAYALFGGVPKGRPVGDQEAARASQAAGKNLGGGGHQIRGDINVLFLGDPGLGKSQALQYVHQTYPRTVLTTGKGASAVGLTAGVRRDPNSGEWTIEGGAMVLADTGICLIDEFDKMSDTDRVSIHEAMEQQSISISKAGIVATLRARCSMIAAANPRFGRYHPSLTFKENVNLSDPILSRFDLIAVLRDIPSLEEDHRLAEYVVSNHQLNHPIYSADLGDEAEERRKMLVEEMFGSLAHETIDQELLKKYIVYARKHVHPRLLDPSIVETTLSSFYARMRQTVSRAGGVPITLRHVESTIRLAEANAKMRLSSTVTALDVDYAIATMLDSFISSQRKAVAAELSSHFPRYRALARGSWDLLTETAKRLIAENVERKLTEIAAIEAKRLVVLEREQRTHSRARPTSATQEQELEVDHIKSVQASLAAVQLGTLATVSQVKFEQEAMRRHRFSRQSIEKWYQSSQFKAQWIIDMTPDGVASISSRSWRPGSRPRAVASSATEAVREARKAGRLNPPRVIAA